MVAFQTVAYETKTTSSWVAIMIVVKFQKDIFIVKSKFRRKNVKFKTRFYSTI